MRQRDDEHHRAGKVRVIRGVRIDVESRERALPHLIGDSSGLLVAPAIEARALQSSEPRERGVDHPSRVDPRRMESGGERVASEYGRIYGHPCLRREPLVARTLQQRIRRDVAQIAPHDFLGDAIAGDRHTRDARAPVAPIRLGFADLALGRHVRVIDRAHLQHEPRMVLRIEPEPRRQPPVGRNPIRVAARSYDGAIRQPCVLVGKLETRFISAYADRCLLVAVASKRFLEVREVRAQHPGQLELHPLVRAVGHVQRDVQRRDADVARDADVQRPMRNTARVP